jgi:hypothetical protein
MLTLTLLLHVAFVPPLPSLRPLHPGPSRRPECVLTAAHSSPPPPPSKSSAPDPRLVTLGLVILWYATSVVANQTSKRLLSVSAIGTSALTLSQLLIATACGGLVIFVFKLAPHNGITSRAQALDMGTSRTSIHMDCGGITACSVHDLTACPHVRAHLLT